MGTSTISTPQGVNPKLVNLAIVLVIVCALAFIAFWAIPKLTQGAKTVGGGGQKIVAGVQKGIKDMTRAELRDYALALVRNGTKASAPAGSSFEVRDTEVKDAIYDFENSWGQNPGFLKFLIQDTANYEAFAFRYRYLGPDGAEAATGMHVVWLDKRTGEWENFPDLKP